ncbi:2-amino-4-hydroxy-6-hydroxymethyldihydropteridine diphosphokinase [Marinospirillum alkaliphilum]|uniref:2-amino-4-hydroxy-6-hydroxymethyldihydropteridine pyrophosphokinase n=1 Tax=Marinospirillum alkaliphilum DSM 21637 TaxID=1122209 RepID=A0A1K1WJH2_9GAMM|nr:2-amino-4-hydroxy-6-hydroxymethyldihydropteridine diphosphokinase [Marinospirillum alkaliphilum]SFX37108.1 2-amino-4-hydroxy-6-hydroxymethyldihydropteridinediphosphokinase [Marinospirillum alkaliphilum DSM 21637]
MARAWIGLGSNLDQPVQQIQGALQALAQLPASHLCRASRLWHSKPMGPQDQPDYVNAVAELETQLEPLQLLDALQSIEQAHHRVRVQHWGPRTLDLDLLLYDQQRINHPRLKVPHPGISQRAFVLLPLAELNDQLLVPDHGPVAQLLGALSTDEIKQVLPFEAEGLSTL